MADLETTVRELCDAYEEWAVCWEVEQRARQDEVRRAISHGMSATAAKQLADANTVDLAVETLKLSQHIKALEAWRDFLLHRP